MGSSLTVSPACNMPELTATFSSDLKPNAGKLVICNLQNTPLVLFTFLLFIYLLRIIFCLLFFYYF